MSHYIQLLAAAVRFNWHKDLAYFSAFVISTIVTGLHIISSLILYFVVFDNTDSVAGYNRDQMLLLYLLGQVAFYLYTALFHDVPRRLSRDINRGLLDLVLLRPKNKIVVLAAESLKMLELVRGAFLSAILVVLIDWSQTEVSTATAPIGVIIVIGGVVLIGLLHMTIASLAFWVGESERLVIFTSSISTQRIPYDAANFAIKLIAFYIFPMLISSGLSMAVMTGRVSIVTGLSITGLLLLTFSLVARLVWRAGLRQYTSASS